MIKQQEAGVHNINLVTPTMYAYQIIEAIKIARKNGLNIPIIYNSNGYENVETIKDLKGYIDVYLPDLKYYSNEIAVKYSKAPNYFEIVSKAILEMISQVGEPIFDKDGMIKKGGNDKTFSASKPYSKQQKCFKVDKRKHSRGNLYRCNGTIFSYIQGKRG